MNRVKRGPSQAEGAIVTRAAELAPELIGQLVYVAAFVPTQLGAAGAYLALPEGQTALGDGLYLGVGSPQSQTGQIHQMLGRFGQRTEAVLDLGDQACQLRVILDI